MHNSASVRPNNLFKFCIAIGFTISHCRMIDMVGFKVFAEISKILVEHLPDRFYTPKLIPVLLNTYHEGNLSTFSAFFFVGYFRLDMFLVM